MNRTNSTLRWFCVLVVGILGTWLFHLPQFASHFDKFPGDRGDARLVAYLMEHWHQVFQGVANWRSPAMFYPVEGTIGYADLMLGYGVVFSGLRALGLGIFEAAEFSIILFNFLNYLVCFVLLHKVLRLHWLASIAGAAFFAFSNPKLVQLGHLQLQPILFLPLFLIAVILFVQKRDTLTQAKAFGLIALAALALDLQLLTGFYPGWFFIFWSALFLLLTLLFKRTRRVVFDQVRKFWRPLLGGVAVFVVGMIPFVLAYLPIMRSIGGPAVRRDPKSNPGAVVDLADESTKPRLGKPFGSDPGGASHESRVANRHRAYSVARVASPDRVCRLVHDQECEGRRRRRPTTNEPPVSRTVNHCNHFVLPDRHAVLARLQPVAVCLLLRSRSTGDQSGRTLRARSRAADVDRVCLRDPFRRRKNFCATGAATPTALFLVLFCVASFGLAEQAAGKEGFDGFSIKAENEYLSRVAQSLPNNCSSFYVTVKPAALHNQFEYHIDAAFVSIMKRVPTINGYSGQLPPNWNLWDMMGPGYETNVKYWIDQNHLNGNVCRLAIPETTAANDIADPEVFIRQQYLDVLRRQPDPAGLQTWLTKLSACPRQGGRASDKNCDREYVALGILDSSEFCGSERFCVTALSRGVGKSAAVQGVRCRS